MQRAKHCDNMLLGCITMFESYRWNLIGKLSIPKWVCLKIDGKLKYTLVNHSFPYQSGRKIYIYIYILYTHYHGYMWGTGAPAQSENLCAVHVLRLVGAFFLYIDVISVPGEWHGFPCICTYIINIYICAYLLLIPRKIYCRLYLYLSLSLSLSLSLFTSLHTCNVVYLHIFKYVY